MAEREANSGPTPESFKVEAVGGDDWDEYRRYVLFELKRHNLEMERHSADDAQHFAAINAKLSKIENKIAYFCGGLAVLILVVNLVMEIVKLRT